MKREEYWNSHTLIVMLYWMLYNCLPLSANVLPHLVLLFWIMSLLNRALFLTLIFFIMTSYGYKITFYKPEGMLSKIWIKFNWFTFHEETSTPIVYPVGPTAWSHGKLRIKYWANLTAPTTTPLNFETVHRAIETYLNQKIITSRIDDTKLYGQSGSSNILVVNRKNILILIIFIICI